MWIEGDHNTVLNSSSATRAVTDFFNAAGAPSKQGG
jgi:hypothetical protein